MWEDEYWNPETVEEEVKAMKEFGMNLCRFFILSPSFLPSPGKISEVHIKRLNAFLEICEKHKLKTIPTFIVGHMSGENWDFEFREGRDLYSDPYMIEQQEFLIREITKKVKDFDSIWGYLLTNEMPLYGGEGSPGKVINWAKKLVKAVKAIDPDRPVGIGDGNWNVFGGNNGFDIPGLSKIVDFFGPHMYVPETDYYRHSVITEFMVRFLRPFGLPVLFEEFGASSSHASDENIALYYREIFLNTFLSGGTGNLGWCLNDFSYSEMPPYRHHPFELRFGVFDKEGKPKPAAYEFRSFRNQVVDFNGFSSIDPQAAILVPSYYNRQYPFSVDKTRVMARQMLQAMVMAAKAGFEVDFLFEDNLDNLKKYKLIIAPCARKLLATTTETLHNFVKNGGNLYMSYFAGADLFQPGMWIHNFEDLTGCKHDSKYGLFDALTGDIELDFQGHIWKIRAQYGEYPHENAYLPLKECNGKLIKLSEKLFFTETKLNRGKVSFLNFPLEHLLLKTPMVNHTDLSYIFYRKAARDAGITLFYTDNPLIRLRLLSKGDEKLAVLQNVSWDKQKAEYILAPFETRISLELSPKEYKVMRI
ncbi:hypothetical protein AT15_09955 [Kosmotoga arenicorallina S304]|uniref:Beta-galactosidase trimerisation domain-containing protein n=1 Tax=Kosmotoga arenicorallina S304 TaxID=1453497 RepID=A0A176K123_9BACT|nr:cellulase family glycosylhydrolase [Kosmotoga arenicorallina]OAA30736.1 hypothetical protein AT15_09955 [Kosmotoga arenicorallina S304]